MRDSGELTAAAIAVCVTKGSGDKGVGSEWHLLKLFRVAIFADVLAGGGTWCGE